MIWASGGPSRRALGALFGRLGGLLGASWGRLKGLLGASYSLSGPKGRDLDLVFLAWDPYGAHPEALSGRLRGLLGPSVAVLELSWEPPGPSGESLGPTWTL